MNKLKIKDSIYVLEDPDGDYHFIFTSTRKIKKFQVDELSREIINKLSSGGVDKVDFISSFGQKYNLQRVVSCLNAMEHEGILRRYSEEETSSRHLRQISFLDELTPSFEETKRLQQKIENSTISVFGVGGIGSWIVNGLYQIGIGNIRITDPDIIEESNLGRQLFFGMNDLGRYKVDVIKEKLPDAKITTFKKIVSEKEDLEEIVSGADFLVNCADIPSVEETTRILDYYAQKHNIPYCVAGGYNLHLGMVGPIIIPGKTSTFQDFLDAQKSRDPLKNFKMIKNIEQTGSLGPIAGAVANMQLMEIFKFLIRKGKLNLNKFAEIDFMDFSVSWRDF